MPDPLPLPPPSPGTNWGNGMADAYPAVGLAGLAQGFTQGLQIGQHWGNQADQLQAHREQMADSAAWRNQALRDREESIANTAAHQKAMEKILGGAGGNAEVFKNALLSGDLAPEQLALLGGGMAGANARQAALGGALKEGYKPKEAQLGYAEQKYEKGSQAQTRQRVGEAVSPLIDKMRGIVDKTDLSDYPMVNTLSAAAAKQAGSTKYTDLEQQAKLISDEIQSMVGVGSDQKLKLIQGISDPTHQGKKQLLNGLEAVDTFVKSRVKAFGGGGDKPKRSDDQHAQAVAWAKANPGDPRSASILKINGQ